MTQVYAAPMGAAQGSAVATQTFPVLLFLYHIPPRQTTWKCFESVLETCVAAKTVEKMKGNAGLLSSLARAGIAACSRSCTNRSLLNWILNICLFLRLVRAALELENGDFGGGRLLVWIPWAMGDYLHERWKWVRWVGVDTRGQQPSFHVPLTKMSGKKVRKMQK